VKKPILAAVGVVVAAIGCLVIAGWYHLFRVVPHRIADPLERFYYGNIGVEFSGGLPKPIFEVAPELCPDLLPGGYASLGWVYQKGHDLPVGLAETTVGFPRVSFNCATCHHGSVRTAPDAEPLVFPAMPAVRLDFQRHVQFLFECLGSDRLTADKIIPLIEKHHPLSFLQRLFYRYAIVPKTREFLVDLRAVNSWHKTRPPFLPGRYDVINTIRKWAGGDPLADKHFGVVDLPAIWNMAAHKRGSGLWDGSSGDLSERNRIAGMVTGAAPDSLSEDEMIWMEQWLSNLAPPKFPFPIDEKLAAKGQAVYQANCTACHQGRVGDVMPLAEIGTDPSREGTMTKEAVAALNVTDRGPYKIRHFTKSNGYRIPPLDGIWATAPYLHNGAVPSMRALLTAPDQRPRTYHRGYDLYDPKDLGFVSTGPEAEKNGALFDTAGLGNGNQGHDYGTSLDEESKVALLEFLKKL
jgi:hypothetical protein